MPKGGAEGMIVTDGGRFGGYGLYLLKGKPVFLWNLLDLKRVRWEGKEALAPGKHRLEYDFKYDGLGFATLAFNNISGIGRPSTGTLKVDGKVGSSRRPNAQRRTPSSGIGRGGAPACSWSMARRWHRRSRAASRLNEVRFGVELPVRRTLAMLYCDEQGGDGEILGPGASSKV